MEKSTLGGLYTEEIQKIMPDNAVTVTTKKLQSSALDILAVRIR